MQWTILFCLSVLFTHTLCTEVSTLYTGGDFTRFAVDGDIRQTENGLTIYVSHSQRCVTAFHISSNAPAGSKLTVSRVSAVEAEHYAFSQAGEATAPGPITFTSPVCSSYWKIVVSGATAVTDVSITHEKQGTHKRAVTCPFGGGNPLYPPECSSASDGAKCLSNGNCGCGIDTDCFGNTDYPFCISGVCEPCYNKATTTNPNDDHLACLPRYPGLTTHPSTGDPLPLERAAPLNYYREVCVRNGPSTSGGACQRCNQAPLLAFGFPTQASNEGASGTAHCNSIRPTRAICMDQTYFTDAGASTLYNASLRGACVPCVNNALCARALPNRPICVIGGGNCRACGTNGECSAFSGKNCMADGTCVSCVTDADCGTRDGGEKANQPSCNPTTGICGDPFVCSTNTACSSQSGKNCQVSGSCISCNSNALCGPGQDGGEVISQPVCNVATGICTNCATNANCVGTSGSNCQASGLCVTCTANALCGPLDGGETPGQTICNLATGICENPCVRNLDCASKPGKNCNKDGSCKSCASNNDCGTTDGGETQNQPQCSVATGICVTPFTCTTNPSCVGNGGANCQKDGTCISCTGTTTCGAADGGEIQNQPNCQLTSRQCVEACATNAGCAGTQGANCNKDGTCRTCTSNALCGATDGGEIQGQTICNVATGICESPCNVNGDCAGKPGKNCQADGSCLSCASNSNCGVLDGGESKGQTECQVATGICVDPFKCTTNPSCQGQAGTNCMADKSCRSCRTNVDCGALDGGEVPGQPICNAQTGLCGFCTKNEDCPLAARNCGINGLCYPCSYGHDGRGCGSLDGPPNGPDNNQPNCDEKEGVCVDGCTRDEHCTTDQCKPYCNVAKRCCAECVTSTHCPHANWRPELSSLSVCSTLTNECVAGCSVDADCGGDNPACATSLGICVPCVYTEHCATIKGKPYCHPTELVCTDVNGWVNNSLSGGAIAGIVIGCIAGILLIIILTLVLASAMGK